VFFVDGGNFEVIKNILKNKNSLVCSGEMNQTAALKRSHTVG
jgi:hypothetical protein